MTEYGYARVSAKGQSLNDQVGQLMEISIDKSNIYSEKFTGTTTNRPKPDGLTNKVRNGDTITATKLDRLARDTRETLNVLDPLMSKDIKLNILSIGILENSTTGKLVKIILLIVTEMERDMIVDRIQGEKRYARLHKRDYHEGRPKRLITPHYQAAYDYLSSHIYKDTAGTFNISVLTLQRIKKQAEDS